MIFCIQFVIIIIFLGTELLGFSIQLDDTTFEEYTTKPYVISLVNNNFSPCIDTGVPNSTWDSDDTPPNMCAISAISHDYFYNQYDGNEINK